MTLSFHAQSSAGDRHSRSGSAAVRAGLQKSKSAGLPGRARRHPASGGVPAGWERFGASASTTCLSTANGTFGGSSPISTALQRSSATPITGTPTSAARPAPIDVTYVAQPDQRVSPGRHNKPNRQFKLCEFCARHKSSRYWSGSMTDHGQHLRPAEAPRHRRRLLTPVRQARRILHAKIQSGEYAGAMPCRRRSRGPVQGVRPGNLQRARDAGGEPVVSAPETSGPTV